MHWGSPSESFKDFTGGVTMTYKLREAHSSGHDAELWLTLKRAIQCQSLICCGTFPKGVRTFLDEHLAFIWSIWTCSPPFPGCFGQHCFSHWTGGCSHLFCHSCHWGNLQKSWKNLIAANVFWLQWKISSEGGVIQLQSKAGATHQPLGQTGVE